MIDRLIVKFATTEARVLVAGAAMALAIFVLSLTLIRSANDTDDTEPCWTVTDVAGRVTKFESRPKFDVNIRAIPFENDGVAGWIFPARVEQNLSCAE